MCMSIIESVEDTINSYLRHHNGWPNEVIGGNHPWIKVLKGRMVKYPREKDPKYPREDPCVDIIRDVDVSS